MKIKADLDFHFQIRLVHFVKFDSNVSYLLNIILADTDTDKKVIFNAF